jgi:hypothetical protein
MGASDSLSYHSDRAHQIEFLSVRIDGAVGEWRHTNI